jgi:hypothetical protein
MTASGAKRVRLPTLKEGICLRAAALRMVWTHQHQQCVVATWQVQPTAPAATLLKEIRQLVMDAICPCRIEA